MPGYNNGVDIGNHHIAREKKKKKKKEKENRALLSEYTPGLFSLTECVRDETKR